MSIHGKRFSAVCCIAALAAAAVFGQARVAPPAGDVNADGRLDVLDVQALAAKVLEDSSQATPGDANGDGLIDIRDFQAVVAALHEPSKPTDQPPADESGSKAYFACHGDPLPLLLHSRSALTEPPARPKPRVVAPTRQARAAEYPIQRFLYHLTPNAPPSSKGGPCLA